MRPRTIGSASRRNARWRAPLIPKHRFSEPCQCLSCVLHASNALRVILVGCCFVALNGCQTTQNLIKAVQTDRETSQELLHHIGAVVTDEESDPIIQLRPSISVKQGADFSTRGAELPNWLQEDHAIRFASTEPATITEILEKLSQLTDLPYVLLVGADGIPLQQNNFSGGDGELASFGLEQSIYPDMNDSLPAILDQLSEQFGLAWRYEDSHIILRQFVVGRYHVAALPSQSTFSSSVGGTSSSGSIDLPGEITAAITMIAGDDARVSFGEASGLLTVIARPRTQLQVAEYVREFNAFMRQQVTFDVNVLTVSHRQTEQFVLDFDVFTSTPKGKSFRWKTEQPKLGGANVNVGIFSGNVDLQFMISALAKLGDVSVETRAGATTANNQIVPIQVVNQTAYAKSIKTLVYTNGESGTTIEPGTLTSGFEMLLLPRILASGDVLLRYSIKLSDLNELENFTSDKQIIQLPRLSTTSFEQQAILGNNEVLVLMGFERDRKTLQNPGTGLLAGLTGIRNHTDTERISTVLTIRPRFKVAH